MSVAQWTQLSGFEGGQILTFATYKNKVLAGTNGGIYQTADAASTWNYLSEDYLLADFGPKVYTMEILASANYLYSRGQSFKRSSDDGATWQKLGITDSVGIFDVTLLNDTMYVMGSANGGPVRLYRSSDNGDSFVAGAFVPGQFTFLTQMEAVNNKLYFIIPDFFNGDSIKTSANGMAFENVPVTGIPAGSQLNDLVGDGTNLYLNLTNFNAGFINTVYKYDGISWSDIGTGIPAQSQLFDLFYAGNTLFTPMFDGASFTIELYRLEGGETIWEKATTSGLTGIINTIIPIGTDSLLSSSFGNTGVLFSPDNGTTWEERNTGLNATKNFLVKGMGANNVVAAGPQNILVSSDNGNTFTASNTGLPAFLSPSGLKKNKNAVYLEIFNPSSIYYSTNDGGSWTQLPYPAGQTSHAGFYPTDGGLYLTIRNFNNAFKVYRSSNQGMVWTEITAGLPADIDTNQATIFSGNATELFLAGRTTAGANKIYRSTDKGISYTLDMTGIPAGFSSDRSVVNTLTCPDSTFYLVITDTDNNTDSVYIRSGNKWESIFGKYNTNNGISYAPTVIVTNFTNAVFESNGTIYTVMFDSIYRSNDQGNSWTVHQTGMYPAVRPFSLIPTTSGLLSSTFEHGVWKNAQLVNGTDNMYPGLENMLYNFPNPASDYTFISYAVRKSGKVEMELFDASGRKIRVLMNEIQPKGHYNLRINTSDLKQGVYFYTLKANGSGQAGKLIVN